MGAVSRAESVIDVEIAQRRELLRQRGIILLLAREEPGILGDCDSTTRQALAGSDRLVRERILQKRHRCTQQLLQRLDHGLHGILGIRPLLRPAQVG